MGSRYLAEKKWKTKRSQFIIKLDAIAVAMVVGIGTCHSHQQVLSSSSRKHSQIRIAHCPWQY